MQKRTDTRGLGINSMRKSIYLLTTTPSSHTHRFHPLPLATSASCSPQPLATPIHSTHWGGDAARGMHSRNRLNDLSYKSVAAYVEYAFARPMLACKILPISYDMHMIIMNVTCTCRYWYLTPHEHYMILPALCISEASVTNIRSS